MPFEEIKKQNPFLKLTWATINTHKDAATAVSSRNSQLRRTEFRISEKTKQKTAGLLLLSAQPTVVLPYLSWSTVLGYGAAACSR